MLYEIIPGAARKLDAKLVQDRTRIPMLELRDWDLHHGIDFGTHLHARMMAGLATALPIAISSVSPDFL